MVSIVISPLDLSLLLGTPLQGVYMFVHVQSVRLVELLDEAKLKCQGTIKERRHISNEELDSASGIMGYAAVKYADLKNNRTTNYK